MPIASTNPNNVNVLTENPSNGKTMNVPNKATGTVNIGINVALKLCRKMKTTKMTNTNASNNVCTIDSIDAVIGRVESSVISTLMSGGKACSISASRCLISFAVANAFAPGAR